MVAGIRSPGYIRNLKKQEDTDEKASVPLKIFKKGKDGEPDEIVLQVKVHK